MEKEVPKHYKNIRMRYEEYGQALSELGKAIKKAGPIDDKTAHLIQLGGAAAIRSEGGVHSHTRRALEQGASSEEIYHSVLLLTSVIGFPNVAAAISWIDDIVLNE
ncbi:MAG: carboxymuconolactone decarboxylase family protein [Methanobacterium sp.]|jgi:alkylhydroperoxidase/carboxymuconolactone decarboxylase family protein YurZ|uniref:carboxymuconolactone decarboxylase family protein n=1 Tax=Methanobacterium sp. TaxID=2164 RepID=UPI00258A0188|nr:carboxymuconolactone decarboxylase family protein [Methanobacterium sp.]MCC7560070.1 carboxymuconolactone decarboxylase family protein [Methanobacterium sp.]